MEPKKNLHNPKTGADPFFRNLLLFNPLQEAKSSSIKRKIYTAMKLKLLEIAAVGDSALLAEYLKEVCVCVYVCTCVCVYVCVKCVCVCECVYVTFSLSLSFAAADNALW